MSASDGAALRESLRRGADWVEARLRALPVMEEDQSGLASHAAYSLHAGGKRVRPFLVRSACSAVGGPADAAIHAAAAVEMVHTYSLVHDDLPQMDDDDLRRGLPTLHRRAGTRQALLAGDLLLVEAFRELARTELAESLVALMCRRLAVAAGPSYLVGGQVMDMFPPEEPDLAWMDRMIGGKTAAMIRVSLELGALAGGMDPDGLEPLSGAGDRLGFVFQLTDDLLDVTGTEAEMGKVVAKDAGMGKANYVTVHGPDRARELARDEAAETAEMLRRLPGDWSEVAGLALFLPERRS
ncbi:MAG: polyprenyl synthetase family protein [Candidatus Fermentibacteraceae bacterium]